MEETADDRSAYRKFREDWMGFVLLYLFFVLAKIFEFRDFGDWSWVSVFVIPTIILFSFTAFCGIVVWPLSKMWEANRSRNKRYAEKAKSADEVMVKIRAKRNDKNG